MDALLPTPVKKSVIPEIAPPRKPGVAPVLAYVFVALAFLAANDPLFFAALVVSFNTIVNVSPTFLARVSSNNGLNPTLIEVLVVGNKLPRFAGVSVSGFGRTEVGVAKRVGLSAVAQALKSAGAMINILINRNTGNLRMIIVPRLIIFVVFDQKL